MKLCAVSDSLGNLPFEEAAKASADLGLEALEIGMGNWSAAPHANLQSLLESKVKRREFLSVFERNGLSLAALNCSGNQLHPVDGGRLQTCRQLIDEGQIGEVTGASAFVVSHGHEWFHPNPDFLYKPGGGPLLDIGPYYVTALVSLLGAAKRCCAMSRRTFATRVIESRPNKGKTIDVEVDTHVGGNIEFASGAIATLIASFDVWDSELPRLEIYGTKGTICIRDIDPLDGPNLFGGPVLLRTVDNYRWKSLPRQTPYPEWKVAPDERPFN